MKLRSKNYVSDPKMIVKDPKNAHEVGKLLNYTITIANSDLNLSKL